VAKAIALTPKGNSTAQQGLEQYGKGKYVRYHGSADGWAEIVAAAVTQTAPPAHFAASIKPAPTPAELAVKAVQENDVRDLSFSDWEFILAHRNASPANQQAAQKVWDAILAKQGMAKLKIPMLVISATRDTVTAAITDDNRAARKADVTVTMMKPMVKLPAPGTEIDLIGSLTEYTAEPFMFIMREGETRTEGN
jgi:hypothetical protein